MQGKRKKETADYFSKGITLVVFLLLLVQFVFFALAVLRRNGLFFEPEVIVVRDTVRIYYPQRERYPRGEYESRSVRPVRPPAMAGNSMPSTSAEASSDGSSSSSVYGVPPSPAASPLRTRRILDLNTADSLELLDLYGIGPYYAHKILAYRQRLGGFVAKEQLMEIHGIDRDRYNGFSDNVTADAAGIERFSLFHVEAERMEKHPYIGYYAAKGIVRMRKMVGEETLTIDLLVENGVLTAKQGDMLEGYVE